jgi:hypothetical protein
MGARFETKGVGMEIFLRENKVREIQIKGYA